MYDVDLEQFWKDDQLAHEENCFSKRAPQVALGIRMSDECVFAELGEEGEPWGYTPRERRIELNKRYNDKAEKIVGKRLLRENFPLPEEVHPPIRDITEVFGCKREYRGGTTWVHPSCSTPEELRAILDRVERMDIRSFILPENWEEEKRRIYEMYGKKPSLWRSVRGPVTLATSIYGTENLIFLLIDEPGLAERFSRVISDVIFQIAAIMDEEAGYGPGEAPPGFQFNDDNCCLLTPQMYESFGYPILKRIFDHWSPKPGDFRYQHSDSDMKHLIPILARLNLTGCNFGPTVLVEDIRRYMPNTRIDGCLSPITFMYNDEKEIIAQVKRDCEAAKESRGLRLSTAGSINNGSLLSSMRVVMWAIQTYGRY